jgi:hypothetical protein
MLFSEKTRNEEKPETGCWLDELGKDMLCSIFSMLSYEERNKCRLVCKRWQRLAFEIEDSRIFVANIEETIAERFFEQNPSLKRIGRTSVKRLIQLAQRKNFPKSRIVELRVQLEKKQDPIPGHPYNYWSYNGVPEKFQPHREEQEGEFSLSPVLAEFCNLDSLILFRRSKSIAITFPKENKIRKLKIISDRELAPLDLKDLPSHLEELEL